MISRTFFVSRTTAENTPGWNNWAVVSISDPETYLPPVKLMQGWYAVHRVSFHDLADTTENRANYQIFDSCRADEIVSFVHAVAPHVEGIMVHCQGGVSRSAAIAKWIAEAYNLPFNHSYQQYNQDVYWVMYEAGRLLKP